MISQAGTGLLSPRSLWVDTLRHRLQAGEQVRVAGVPFLVRRARQEVGHSAGPYLKCELGDQTGWIEAVWWGAGRLGTETVRALLAAEVWVVEGAGSLNRFAGRETPQVKLEVARGVAGTEASGIPGLIRRSATSEEELGGWLSTRIAEVANTPLRLLLEDTLGETGCWRTAYLRAPAALFHHHAYVGGLIDHTREMATMWLASTATFPRVDRDLTLAGILLHDVGKLDTYSHGTAPQLSRTGRYADHITTGVARLTLALDARHDFPPVLRDHLLHIVASHHGAKEHGSPVLPATREAIVVHHLDRLSSLLSHLEEWTQQVGVDEHGWTTESSPWLKVSLARSPQIPDENEE